MDLLVNARVRMINVNNVVIISIERADNLERERIREISYLFRVTNMQRFLNKAKCFVIWDIAYQMSALK